MKKTIFVNANISFAKIRHANLEYANLYKADLTHSDLTYSVLRNAHLSGAALSEANFTHADLKGADLRESTLVKTVFREHANLNGCWVYGISAWGVEIDSSTQQSDLRITAIDEPTISVEYLEVAQFMYLLLNNEKIRDVIDTIGKKGVLIIGRFTEERKAILHAIRDELKNRYQLLPIMFEFDPLSNEPTIKTLSTMAHLSRFVIADLTEAKSVLQELTKILQELPTLPVQLILHELAEMPPMADSFLAMHSVLKPPYIYSTKDKLIEDLPIAVVGPPQDWASKFESELAEIRQKWLPWQSK